jgi:hypothetical protein
MALQLYKIATVEVGSAGAANIAFSSIPQGYTDLKLVISGRGSAASGGGRESILMNLVFNGSGGTYSGRILRTTGTTGSSFASYLAGYINASSYTANTFSNSELYIPNYTSGNQKSFSGDTTNEQNVSAYDSVMGLQALLWSGTAAINQITLTLDYGNFAQYSTATLYGIL